MYKDTKLTKASKSNGGSRYHDFFYNMEKYSHDPL